MDRTGFANFDWQDAGQFKTDKKENITNYVHVIVKI